MKEPKKPSPMPTVAEMERRVTEVQKYLLNGYTRSYIHEAVKAWGLGERQIDHVIKKATDKIKEINNFEREENMATITTNLWELFRACRDEGNVIEARKILMDIAKLRGLEETTVNHVLHDRPLSEVDEGDLEDALDTSGNGRH